MILLTTPVIIGFFAIVVFTILWMKDLSFLLKGQTAKQVEHPAVDMAHQVRQAVEFSYQVRWPVLIGAAVRPFGPAPMIMASYCLDIQLPPCFMILRTITILKCLLPKGILRCNITVRQSGTCTDAGKSIHQIVSNK